MKLSAKSMRIFRRAQRKYKVPVEILQTNMANIQAFLKHIETPHITIKRLAKRKRRGDRDVVILDYNHLSRFVYDPLHNSTIKLLKRNAKQWSRGMVMYLKSHVGAQEYLEDGDELIEQNVAAVAAKEEESQEEVVTSMAPEEVSKQLKEQLELLRCGKRLTTLIEGSIRRQSLAVPEIASTRIQEAVPATFAEALSTTVTGHKSKDEMQTDNQMVDTIDKIVNKTSEMAENLGDKIVDNLTENQCDKIQDCLKNNIVDKSTAIKTTEQLDDNSVNKFNPIVIDSVEKTNVNSNNKVDDSATYKVDNSKPTKVDDSTTTKVDDSTTTKVADTVETDVNDSVTTKVDDSVSTKVDYLVSTEVDDSAATKVDNSSVSKVDDSSPNLIAEEETRSPKPTEIQSEIAALDNSLLLCEEVEPAEEMSDEQNANKTDATQNVLEKTTEKQIFAIQTKNILDTLLQKITDKEIHEKSEEELEVVRKKMEATNDGLEPKAIDVRKELEAEKCLKELEEDEVSKELQENIATKELYGDSMVRELEKVKVVKELVGQTVVIELDIDEETDETEIDAEVNATDEVRNEFEKMNGKNEENIETPEELGEENVLEKPSSDKVLGELGADKTLLKELDTDNALKELADEEQVRREIGLDKALEEFEAVEAQRDVGEDTEIADEGEADEESDEEPDNGLKELESDEMLRVDTNQEATNSEELTVNRVEEFLPPPPLLQDVCATEKPKIGGSNFLDMLMSKVRVRKLSMEPVPTTNSLVLNCSDSDVSPQKCNESDKPNHNAAPDTDYTDSSEEFLGFEENEPLVPGMLLTPMVPFSLHRNTNNSAFVSESLNAYMRDNLLESKDATEDESKTKKDFVRRIHRQESNLEGLVTSSCVAPTMQMPAVPESLLRLRTVAERRQYLQKFSKNHKLSIINNEATIYRELQRKKRQQKVKSVALQQLQAPNTQMPFTRQGWKAASFVVTDYNKYYFQMLQADGELMRLTGVRGNNEEKLKKPYTTRLPPSQKTFCGANCFDLLAWRDFKSIKTHSNKAQLIKNPFRPVFKPCPLSQKPFQRPLDVETAALLLAGGSMAVVRMPAVALQVFPALGKPLHDVAKRYLQHILPHHDISREWAEFSVSTLQQQKQGAGLNAVAEQTAAAANAADGVVQRKSFTFAIPYLNDRSHILVRRVVDRSEQLDCSFEAARDTASAVADLSFRADIDASDTLLLECADVVSDMINSVAISCSENSFIKDDPHGVTAAKPVAGAVEEVTAAAALEEKTAAQQRSAAAAGKALAIVQPQPNKKQNRLLSELRRLNATIIDAAAKPETTSKPCSKPYCTLGCVCSSLADEHPLRQHCGKSKCVIECSCRVPKSSSIMRLETDGRSITTEDAFLLRRKATARLARMEKEFTSTIVLTGNETLLINESQYDKKRRCTKAPKRYDDFTDNDDDYNQQHNHQQQHNNQQQHGQQSNKISPAGKKSGGSGGAGTVVAIESTSTAAASSVTTTVLENPSSSPSCFSDLTSELRAPIYIKDTILNELKHCAVTLIPLQDTQNLAVWCMVHELYKCFCGGRAIEGKAMTIETEESVTKTTNAMQTDNSAVLMTDYAPKARYSFEKASAASVDGNSSQHSDNDSDDDDVDDNEEECENEKSDLQMKEQLPATKAVFNASADESTSDVTVKRGRGRPHKVVDGTSAPAPHIERRGRPLEKDILRDYMNAKLNWCRRAVAIPQKTYTRRNRKRVADVNTYIEKHENAKTRLLLNEHILRSVYYHKNEMEQFLRREKQKRREQRAAAAAKLASKEQPLKQEQVVQKQETVEEVNELEATPVTPDKTPIDLLTYRDSLPSNSSTDLKNATNKKSSAKSSKNLTSTDSRDSLTTCDDSLTANDSLLSNNLLPPNELLTPLTSTASDAAGGADDDNDDVQFIAADAASKAEAVSTTTLWRRERRKRRRQLRQEQQKQEQQQQEQQQQEQQQQEQQQQQQQQQQQEQQQTCSAETAQLDEAPARKRSKLMETPATVDTELQLPRITGYFSLNQDSKSTVSNSNINNTAAAPLNAADICVVPADSARQTAAELGLQEGAVSTEYFREFYNVVIKNMNNLVSKKMQDIDMALKRESKIIPPPNDEILCIIKWSNFLDAYAERFIYIWHVQLDADQRFFAATINNVMPMILGAVGVVNIAHMDAGRLPLMGRMLQQRCRSPQTAKLAIVMQGRSKYWLLKGFLQPDSAKACAKPTPQTHPLLTRKINVLCSLLVKQRVKEHQRKLEQQQLEQQRQLDQQEQQLEHLLNRPVVARRILPKVATQLQQQRSQRMLLPKTGSTAPPLISQLSKTRTYKRKNNNKTTESAATAATTSAADNASPSISSQLRDLSLQQELLHMKSNIDFRKVTHADIAQIQQPEFLLEDHRWLVLDLCSDFSHIFVPDFRDLVSLDRILKVMSFSRQKQKTVKLQFFQHAPYDAYVTPSSSRNIYFGPLKLNMRPPLLILLQSVDGKMMLREIYQQEHQIQTVGRACTTAFWILQINGQTHFEIEAEQLHALQAEQQLKELQQQQQLPPQQLLPLPAPAMLYNQQLQPMQQQPSTDYVVLGGSNDDSDEDCMIIDDDVDAATSNYNAAAAVTNATTTDTAVEQGEDEQMGELFAQLPPPPTTNAYCSIVTNPQTPGVPLLSHALPQAISLDAAAVTTATTSNSGRMNFTIQAVGDSSKLQITNDEELLQQEKQQQLQQQQQQLQLQQHQLPDLVPFSMVVTNVSPAPFNAPYSSTIYISDVQPQQQPQQQLEVATATNELISGDGSNIINNSNTINSSNAININSMNTININSMNTININSMNTINSSNTINSISNSINNSNITFLTTSSASCTEPTPADAITTSASIKRRRFSVRCPIIADTQSTNIAIDAAIKLLPETVTGLTTVSIENQQQQQNNLTAVSTAVASTAATSLLTSTNSNNSSYLKNHTTPTSIHNKSHFAGAGATMLLHNTTITKLSDASTLVSKTATQPSSSISNFKQQQQAKSKQVSLKVAAAAAAEASLKSSETPTPMVFDVIFDNSNEPAASILVKPTITKAAAVVTATTSTTATTTTYKLPTTSTATLNNFAATVTSTNPAASTAKVSAVSNINNVSFPNVTRSVVINSINHISTLAGGTTAAKTTLGTAAANASALTNSYKQYVLPPNTLLKPNATAAATTTTTTRATISVPPQVLGKKPWSTVRYVPSTTVAQQTTTSKTTVTPLQQYANRVTIQKCSNNTSPGKQQSQLQPKTIRLSLPAATTLAAATSVPTTTNFIAKNAATSSAAAGLTTKPTITSVATLVAPSSDATTTSNSQRPRITIKTRVFAQRRSMPVLSKPGILSNGVAATGAPSPTLLNVKSVVTSLASAATSISLSSAAAKSSTQFSKITSASSTSASASTSSSLSSTSVAAAAAASGAQSDKQYGYFYGLVPGLPRFVAKRVGSDYLIRVPSFQGILKVNGLDNVNTYLNRHTSKMSTLPEQLIKKLPTIWKFSPQKRLVQTQRSSSAQEIESKTKLNSSTQKIMTVPTTVTIPKIIKKAAAVGKDSSTDTILIDD